MFVKRCKLLAPDERSPCKIQYLKGFDCLGVWQSIINQLRKTCLFKANITDSLYTCAKLIHIPAGFKINRFDHLQVWANGKQIPACEYGLLEPFTSFKLTYWLPVFPCLAYYGGYVSPETSFSHQNKDISALPGCTSHCYHPRPFKPFRTSP